MYCLVLKGVEASEKIWAIDSVIERSKGFVSSVEIQIDTPRRTSGPSSAGVHAPASAGIEEIDRIISHTDLPLTAALRSFEAPADPEAAGPARGQGDRREEHESREKEHVQTHESREKEHVQAHESREKELLLSAAEKGAACIGIDKPGLLSDKDFLKKAESFGAGVMYTLYFNGVPEDCAEKTESAYTLLCGALSRPEQGVIRTVCFLRGVEDAVKLCRLADRLSHVKGKLILGEGEYGLFSGLLYKRLGSLWGYLSPEWIEKCGGARMPDLPGEEPEVFGIIGNPVGHSKSPRIHNRWIESLGLNAVYIPFLVDDPQAFFRLAEILPVKGFSVTVPHKETVIPLLDRLEAPVKKIGSCNTVFRKEGEWIGTNTDYEGFLSPIDTFLKEGSIRTALVIGAGGAARTAVYALCDRGVEVKICNRTADKAEKLAREAGCESVLPESAADSGPYDLVVQTTSVGMEPDVKSDPLPGYGFTGRELVYDIIYTPETTAFLKRAEEEGCRTLGGSQMLRRQAEAQFRIFTGERNPPDG